LNPRSDPSYRPTLRERFLDPVGGENDGFFADTGPIRDFLGTGLVIGVLVIAAHVALLIACLLGVGLIYLAANILGVWWP
jgi:hypothetical protein